MMFASDWSPQTSCFEWCCAIIKGKYYHIGGVHYYMYNGDMYIVGQDDIGFDEEKREEEKYWDKEDQKNEESE